MMTLDTFTAALINHMTFLGPMTPAELTSWFIGADPELDEDQTTEALFMMLEDGAVTRDEDENRWAVAK